jgi:diacylglycerol kinase family enzyme
MRIGAVINASAGGVAAGGAEERLTGFLRALEPTLAAEWRRVVASARVEEAAEELVRRGAEVLLAGGGDGTVNVVAGVALRRGVVLGVLPVGTRNHFARDLNIPPEEENLAALLRDLPVRRIDVGEVNGRIFINNVSIGMYPDLVKEREEHMAVRGLRKQPAHLLAALSVLLRFPVVHCTIHAPGGPVRRLTPVLFVGNNVYEGGLLAEARRTTLAGGALWICTARAAGAMGLLRLSWQAWRGKLDSTKNLDTLEGEEFLIEFRRRQVRVAIDGEAFRMAAPLQFRIRPKALEVVAP